MRRRGMRQLKTARRARRAVPRGGQTLAGAGSGVEGERADWNWARAYQMTVECPSFKRLKTIAYLLQASYLMLL
jgi:hypothetical protein